MFLSLLPISSCSGERPTDWIGVVLSSSSESYLSEVLDQSLLIVCTACFASLLNEKCAVMMCDVRCHNSDQSL